MATVTHHIYSQYIPPQNKDEDAVVQESTEEEIDPWLTESAFGVNRRLKAAPRFVPATVSYDEVNSMIGGASSSLPRAEEPSYSSQVSDWYKSLPRSSSTSPIHTKAITHAYVFSPALHVIQSQSASAPPPGSKHNWFSIVPKHSSSPPIPPPTLADILSREPPPDCKDQPFVPPVFLHIGPSNKGFVMLQQSGWSEGEALGASAPRRTAAHKVRARRPVETMLDEKKSRVNVRLEEREVPVDDDGELVEVQKFEVVDLTLSDSDEDEDDHLQRGHLDGSATSAAADANPEPSTSSAAASSSHNPTALLAPIATVLKSDRLGIGLKAKKVGPHRESKKRVTHNQAALAAHIRANEEMRKKKVVLGRGVKSFVRIARADEESRRLLLASLKAD